MTAKNSSNTYRSYAHSLSSSRVSCSVLIQFKWLGPKQTKARKNKRTDIVTLQFANRNSDNGIGIVALAYEEIWVAKMSCKEKVTKLKSHPPISFLVRSFLFENIFETILSNTFFASLHGHYFLQSLFFHGFVWVTLHIVFFFFFFHLSPNSICMHGMREWMSVQHNCSKCFFFSYHQMEIHIFICRASNLTDSWHFSSIYFSVAHLFVLSDELMCLWMPVLSNCWH